MCVREKERVSVCVCVCVRERERDLASDSSKKEAAPLGWAEDGKLLSSCSAATTPSSEPAGPNPLYHLDDSVDSDQ